MRALIWRYVVNAHSEHEMEPVNEDDIHELKSELSSWRCELLDILQRNGMDIGGVDMKEKSEQFFDHEECEKGSLDLTNPQLALFDDFYPTNYINRKSLNHHI